MKVDVTYYVTPCVHCKATMYLNDDETRCEFCGNLLPIAEALTYGIRQIITVGAVEGESKAAINAKADKVARAYIAWRQDARAMNGVPPDDDYFPPNSVVIGRVCLKCGQTYRQGFTYGDFDNQRLITEAAQAMTRCSKCGGPLSETTANRQLTHQVKEH